jgi:probable HAF family extracellular repeat protein
MEKSIAFTWIIAITVFTALAMPVRRAAQEQSAAQEPGTDVRYTVTDLGPVGGTPGQPYLISNNGLVSGAAANPDGTMHAVLWCKGSTSDIGTPGLGGPNSAAFGVNERGHAVGQAETSVADSEDFCGFNFYGFPSLTACLPFLWQNGVMTHLSTLGGANGFANSINKRGEVAGLAETSITDPAPGCPVFEFQPVIWKNGVIQELHTYPGDTDGVAAFINDRGQAVGASGTCASFNPYSGLYLVENYALLWENGKVTDLGNLGGTGGIAGNHACAINNRGQVVGHSELTNETTFHGFLWTRETGMRDLDTLPGDVASLSLGINDGGEVVGASISPPGPPTGSFRAFLWRNGVMTDLNTLIPANSALYLLLAQSINSSGEIIGLAFDSSDNQAHGFLAAPIRGEAGSESAAPAAQGETTIKETATTSAPAPRAE